VLVVVAHLAQLGGAGARKCQRKEGNENRFAPERGKRHLFPGGGREREIRRARADDGTGRDTNDSHSMESRPGFRAAALTILLLSALACGGGSSSISTTPQPVAIEGDVERTTFAPSLGVDLSAMTKRASGLYVQDLETGTGAVAVRGRSVVVRYAGWLPNGKQFDSGEITVTLGQFKVIRAWEDGILGMRVGGRRRLVSPPNLAYGARGAGDDIPPNAVLVFEMQVMSVL